MAKYLVTIMLVGAGFVIHGSSVYGASYNDEQQDLQDSAAKSVNPVVQWNRTLLVIVRTPGAQPATVHPTRSFAIMHAAIYDAVNAIDGTHKPYLVRLTTVPRFVSRDAAAASAAHEVLVTLYPNFKAFLDDQLQQSLASIQDGGDKAEGITADARLSGCNLRNPTQCRQ